MAILKLEDIKPEEIVFDNDGVVYPFFKPFTHYYNGITGSNFNPEDIKTYDISGLNHSGHKAMEHIVPFHKAPEAGAALKPYKSSIHLFDLFHWAGIRPRIITKRHPDVRSETINSFLRDFGNKVDVNDIHIMGYEHPIKRTKSQVMTGLGAKLIVEDCYANALEAVNAGYLAIIINHHYNQNGNGEIPEEDHDGIFRPNNGDKGLLALIDMIPSLKNIFA